MKSGFPAMGFFGTILAKTIEVQQGKWRKF
jgi:hypothetical protein